MITPLEVSEALGFCLFVATFIDFIPAKTDSPIQIRFLDTLLFYQIEPLKNGVTPILPSSIATQKKKEFLKSCEGFLRATLTGHGHPSPF
jgi:hypothetical protein